MMHRYYWGDHGTTNQKLNAKIPFCYFGDKNANTINGFLKKNYWKGEIEQNFSEVIYSLVCHNVFLLISRQTAVFKTSSGTREYFSFKKNSQH